MCCAVLSHRCELRFKFIEIHEVPHLHLSSQDIAQCISLRRVQQNSTAAGGRARANRKAPQRDYEENVFLDCSDLFFRQKNIVHTEAGFDFVMYSLA